MVMRFSNGQTGILPCSLKGSQRCPKEMILPILRKPDRGGGFPPAPIFFNSQSRSNRRRAYPDGKFFNARMAGAVRSGG
ncbi:MAG: hypothetical protein HDT26_03795 [Subdoligranulum sp.]|nr:hypothetical protein [Subdoligranulum sp.]